MACLFHTGYFDTAFFHTALFHTALFYTTYLGLTQHSNRILWYNTCSFIELKFLKSPIFKKPKTLNHALIGFFVIPHSLPHA